MRMSWHLVHSKVSACTRTWCVDVRYVTSHKWMERSRSLEVTQKLLIYYRMGNSPTRRPSTRVMLCGRLAYGSLHIVGMVPSWLGAKFDVDIVIESPEYQTKSEGQRSSIVQFPPSFLGASKVVPSIFLYKSPFFLLTSSRPKAGESIYRGGRGERGMMRRGRRKKKLRREMRIIGAS